MPQNTLLLKNFRSYEEAAIAFSAPIVCIFGANGSGKTNILEALSLLSPGKGLRKASNSFLYHKKAEDLLVENTSSSVPWMVQGIFHNPTGSLVVETGAAAIDDEKKEEEKKVSRYVKMNHGKNVSHMELSQFLGVQWIVPAMDRLWTEGWSCRRGFFDRWVFHCYPEYGPLMIQYTKLLRERQKLLQEGAPSGWLQSVERLLADHIVSIHKKRCLTIHLLEEDMIAYQGHFPQARFRLQGDFENFIKTIPHEELLNGLMEKLQKTREIDLHRKTTSIGPHRTHVEIFSRTLQGFSVEASFCSTGEQKKILLSLGLALTRLGEKKHPHRFSILLLDDVFSYVDTESRQYFFSEELPSLTATVWMTGTEKNLFPSDAHAEYIHLSSTESTFSFKGNYTK